MGVSQEFIHPKNFKKDYLPELGKLDVEIVPKENFAKYAPNHQSDIFRYWFLKEHGGFYLDTDQIILQSFKSLPLKDNDFLY
jgi:mannosyltransferase OCH1-like enzyme